MQYFDNTVETKDTHAKTSNPNKVKASSIYKIGTCFETGIFAKTLNNCKTQFLAPEDFVFNERGERVGDPGILRVGEKDGQAAAAR